MLRRILEMAASVVLIALCSPLFLITAFVVWVTDFGPVLYKQNRVGLMGRPFKMLKFRSMSMNSQPLDRPEEVGEGDPLVTPIGSVIRRLKVDELPQLINVLRGEMSWVGPRPTVREQTERYTPFQRRRLEVLPGLTGWPQVNGGAEIPWNVRIILDVWYVEHRSILLDVKILFRTVAVILFGNRPNPKAIEQAMQFVLQHPDASKLEMRETSRSFSVDA